MTQTDKAALLDRLSNIGMATPTLAEGQPDTVRDIDTITGEILEAKRVGGEAIITIGQRLIEAKAMLEHGEWLPWLNEKVEFSERTARNFMRLAKDWTNRQALADLGATKALQLLALPESEREEFLSETHQVNGEEKPVIDMTSRELEKAIKERDEARKAAERAEADAKAAQEARQSMEASLMAANALMSRAKMEKEQTSDRVTELEKQLAELKAAPVEVAIATVDQEALDKARAEGEAAKASEIAGLQTLLDQAKEEGKKADKKRKAAEAALVDAQARLEAADKAQKSAAALADPDVAKFEVYFNQAQEVANKLQGLLIKARGREDQTAAEKLSRAMIALGDKIKEAAQ